MLISVLNQSSFNIGTYNIRNTTDRYSERKESLKDTIEQKNCDIIGLQEVSITVDDQTEFLNKDNKYEVIKSAGQIPFKFSNPSLPNCFNLDGNAIFIKKSFLNDYIATYDSKTLNLSGYRTAQLVKFITKCNSEFIFINTHLHHLVEDINFRTSQIEQIFNWIDYLFPAYKNPIIFVGDFNMCPHETDNYNMFSKHKFYSSFKKAHGQEPLKTFPTGIKCDTMDEGDDMTLDYIWIKDQGFDNDNSISVVKESVSIFGDKCVNGDTTLYPSDHYIIILQHIKFSLN